ncbi:hypothetical protein N7532_004470 [Penicillium argentinense]|uniref:Uncharacterized protein n=1 Tax=Penicillium argentinense TaxID=1131581 RepID=A0A9W9FP99_9EURO|nr:uncharacterized protein N7532_004470 [Penicillium argentinense]KAJ5103941.1 hypothetical protein N7532_004470 [Penicillium argentinense]
MSAANAISSPETNKCDKPLSTSGNYQCIVCSRQYKRREHLHRHLASHTSERHFRCESCAGAFQRADVLKRHTRTCDGQPSRAGARRRACDRCVRQKKACSGGQPSCTACSKKKILCVYSAPESGKTTIQTEPRASFPTSNVLLGQHGSNSIFPFGITGPESAELGTGLFDNLLCQSLLDDSSSSWENYLHLMSTSQVQVPCQTSDAHCLPFLHRFTSNTGLVASFECGTQEQREQIASMLELGSSDMVPNTESSSLSSLSQVFSPPLLENLSDPSTVDCIPHNWLSDPLSLKTHEILLLVEEVVRIKPRNSSVTLDWSPTLKNACLQFFSPRNLRRCLEFYWSIWHPNVNIIHRPSFDAVSAKPALLAAMALMGACVSPDMPDNEDARMYLNCVEEIVFIDNDFNSDLSYSSSCSLAHHRSKIQILQAAYIVCLYQNWEGCESSKCRVRRHRFATLVSTARDIGIATATHLDYTCLSRAEFQWKEYSAREEIIRLFTWTFLLDTAFVIFNNLPPRMLFKEMNMHFSTPETCFQAETSDQCYQQILIHLPVGSPYWNLSFRRAFEALSKDYNSPTTCTSIANLGPLNMFALASAIHSQIFQYRSSLSTYHSLSPIRNTLHNWRDAWQAFVLSPASSIPPHVLVLEADLNPRNMWKRNGFYRNCAEYWLLASLMADRLAMSDTLSNATPALAHNSALDPILDKYDQTSMRQINDLITGFQSFQL